MGPDLDDPVALCHDFKGQASVFHRVRKGLFHIGIASRFDCFHTMKGVLKICGADNHSIHDSRVVHLFVVSHARHCLSGHFLEKCDTLIAATVPYVGDRRDLEIFILCRIEECRNESIPRTIGETDDAHANPIVSSEYAAITRSRETQRCVGCPQCRNPEKFPSGNTFFGHDLPSSYRVPKTPRLLIDWEDVFAGSSFPLLGRL